MRSQLEKAQAFRALHERRHAFIVPNPGDAGTARILADLGFEALATTVPCRVDPVTGGRQQLGPPGLYQSLIDSPDGTHLLVHRLQRPFSFRVPWQLFARRAEVWGATGTPHSVSASSRSVCVSNGSSSPSGTATE